MVAILLDKLTSRWRCYLLTALFYLFIKRFRNDDEKEEYPAFSRSRDTVKEYVCIPHLFSLKATLNNNNNNENVNHYDVLENSPSSFFFFNV